MRTTWLAFALLALLPACGDDPGGSTDIQSTLRFADRTDTEIARMINAAVGAEMFQALSRVDDFGDTFDEDPCPAVTVDGKVATAVGGCTTQDGVMITGTAIVTNPPNWDQVETDFGDDPHYQLDELVFSEQGFTQRFDGEISINGSFTTWDADLVTESFGVALRTDIYMSCSGNASAATCTLGESGLELVGVGGARVSGSQRVRDQELTTDLTLRGADTLTVHVADNCVEWIVEGTGRMSTACP